MPRNPPDVPGTYRVLIEIELSVETAGRSAAKLVSAKIRDKLEATLKSDDGKKARIERVRLKRVHRRPRYTRKLEGV